VTSRSVTTSSTSFISPASQMLSTKTSFFPIHFSFNSIKNLIPLLVIPVRRIDILRNNNRYLLHENFRVRSRTSELRAHPWKIKFSLYFQSREHDHRVQIAYLGTVIHTWYVDIRDRKRGLIYYVLKPFMRISC
jgi:hypothetical protein